MAKVLITGATGFLGGHILRQALAGQHQTHVLVRDVKKLTTLDLLDHEREKVKVHEGDLLDADSIKRATSEGFDLLFNVAADTNTYAKNNARQNAINIDGMRNVIAAAKGKIGRVVDTSSTAIYGISDQLINEQSPKLGRDSWINYSRSKALAEELLLGSGLDVVVLNPSHLIGPGDRHNWARLFQLVAQQKLPGAPPGVGSFADVRQVAKAHWTAALQGKSGHNYILGGEEASFMQLCQMIAGELGVAAPKRVIPAWLLSIVAHGKTLLAGWRGQEPDMTPESAALTAHHMQLDLSKAINELALDITPLAALVKDTVHWMRAQKLL